MKEKRRKVWLCLIGILSCAILMVNDQVLAATPSYHAYSGGVTRGTIRYVSQSTSTASANGWGAYASKANGECGYASQSMALSYIGKDISPEYLCHGEYSQGKWHTGYGNGISGMYEIDGISVVSGSGNPTGSTAVNTINSMLTNFMNDNGKGQYSPVVIHYGSSSVMHAIIVIGKETNGNYLTLDPARGMNVVSMTLSSVGAVGGNVTYAANGCKINGVQQYYNASIEPLSISNVRVSDVNSNSYKVSCNIAGNVARVLFPTWPSADDSGNPIWHEGTINGNTASCVIRRSDHGNKTGDYISHIYIYDAAGNSTSAAAPLVVMGDTQAPVISDIRVSEIKMDSFTVTCKVYDNGGVTSVKFPTWPSADDSGNPIWHEGTINGDTASCVIKKSDHGNKTGLYLTHIYAYDMNGNMTTGQAPGVIIGDTEPPVIEDIKIIDVTEESYKITCTVKDDNSSGAISVRFPTWPSADDSGNPIWHEGRVNGDTASCVIKKSEHGNKTGTYISHIYAYDVVGNSSSAAAPVVELGKKHQHVYTSSIKKSATCTEPGIRLYTCKDNDDSYEEEIPATGHQHTELRNVKAASCAQEGYTGDTYCKDCNTKLVSGKVIPKMGHTWDLGKITTAATCNGKGIKTYTCTGCDATRTEEIPSTGHQHTELRNEKAATCAQEGYTGDTYCKDCNTKLTDGKVIPKTEHTWDAGKITTAATCSGKGIKTYTCTECNATKTEEILSTGHQHTELRNVKAASCVQEGYTGDTYCKDCNTKLSSGKVLPKTDHTWDAGKITTAATCSGKGIKTFTCTVCKSTRMEEIPEIGHVNKITKFAKEASCKSEGYTGDVYCQDCGILIEEGKIIPKTEHVWNDGEITTSSTCTTEGTKTYTCTSCGTTKTEAIAAAGHGATEIRNKKDASVTSEGYTGDTYCTICNQKISSGNTIAKLTPQTATPGKTLKDKSTNGVYKVLQDGVSVEYTKPVYKKASVRIPDTINVNGITCKVTGISANAFKNNKSLKSVSIGRNVTVLGTNAFYGCKKLSKVNGGNGIVKIGHRAFANCSSLSKITIPGSVRSIGKQAFCNCKKLRSITIKTSTLSGKTVGSKAFAGTYKKPTVKVPASQLKTYKKLLKARGMSSKAVYRK